MIDHEEMDKMMDVTGAVVDMEESILSLSKYEHWMDKIMLFVMDRPEVIEATLNSGNIGYIGGGFNNVSEVEEWQDDTFGPPLCSTPSQETNKVLAMRGLHHQRCQQCQPQNKS